MIRYDGFMRWFVDYINDVTIEDLKKEPLDWNERMAYLRKKFQERDDAPTNRNDLRLVKCCASCEYRDGENVDDMDTIKCNAYPTRQPKIYEICSLFYPGDAFSKEMQEGVEDEPE